MKLSSAQINQFLQKPDPAIRVILVYGPDAGLVRERAELIAKKIVPDLADPFRVALLSGPALIEDPARLADEMNAQALGGGRRLVRIQQAGDPIAALVNAFLAGAPSGDSLLLIEAGELEKRSKLRAFCEGENQLACAIPCYVEDGPARQRTIGDILRADNLEASREVLAFLADILPPDRMAMRCELEKLALYVKGKTAVTMEDVRAVMQDAGAAALDDLVHAVGGGEAKRASLLLARLEGEQISPVAILRAAQRHFQRLQWARGQMDKGLSAAEAVKKLQPPVFWKYEEMTALQVRRWPQAQIERALARLYETEAAVKKTGMPDAVLCAQLLLQMAGSKQA